MRDFFTGLAARSFAAETGVRPRLASIFEPARNLAPAPMGLSVGREAEQEGIAAPDERQRYKTSRGPSAELHLPTDALRASRELQRHNPTRLSVEERSEDNRVKLVSSKRASDGQASAPDALRPAPVLGPSPENISAAAAMRAEISIETRAFAPPRPRADRDEIEAGIQRPVDASRVSHDGRKRASVPAQEGKQENDLALARSAGAFADLAARMRDVASVMNAAPARRSDGGFDHRATSAAEPIVHVTIGRVEVRATAEAPREKRSRPASPVMGLDEYLRRTAQRGGQ